MEDLKINIGDVFLDENGIRHEIESHKNSKEITSVIIYDEIIEFDTEIIEKRIADGELVLVERSNHVSLSGMQGLNKDLMIPFMEAKGAYHIIAKICELEYLGEGIFKAPSGFKYILTKYGFVANIQYNYQLKYAETIRELRKSRSDYKALQDKYEGGGRNVADLRRQIDGLREKNEKRLTHIERVETHLKEAKEKVSELRKTLMEQLNNEKDE